MDDLLLTTEKVHDVVRKKGSVSLTHLTSVISDVSFNLIFLAIDRLSSEHKINIRRDVADYVLSIPDNDSEKICLEERV